MSIQYNTNSKLISRFQKKLPPVGNLNNNNPGNNSVINSTIAYFNHDSNTKTQESNNYSHRNNTDNTVNNNIQNNNIQDNKNNNNDIPIDTPFESPFVKNSSEYLLQLCHSIYPEELHEQIDKLSKTDGSLELYTFFALILQNFIKHWYGTKIPTNDNEFIILVFNLLKDLINYISNSDWDREMFLLDDVPILISQHMDIIKILRSVNSQIIYKEMCQLYLIPTDLYPNLITDLIKDSLDERSVLQDLFLDALMNKLLLGRVLDSCIEPFYILRGIDKICEKLLNKKIQKESQAFKISFKISNKFVKLYSYGKEIISNIINNYNDKLRSENKNYSLLNRYLFTLLNKNLFKLYKRKPIIYTTLRYIQYYLNRSTTITNYLRKRFLYFTSDKIFNERNKQHLFNLLRQLLFPNDNLMGPRSVIPTGEKFMRYKNQIIDKLWLVVKLNHLNTLLGVSQSDIEYFINTICNVEKGCNKLLVFRILDCYLRSLKDSRDANSI